MLISLYIIWNTGVGGLRLKNCCSNALIDTDEPIILTEFICGEQYMSICVTVDNRQSIT